MIIERDKSIYYDVYKRDVFECLDDYFNFNQHEDFYYILDYNNILFKYLDLMNRIPDNYIHEIVSYFIEISILKSAYLTVTL